MNENRLKSFDENDWGDNEDGRDLRQEMVELLQKQNVYSKNQLPEPDVSYDDDYTDSTASTGSHSMSASAESIEQFINSVRKASTSNTANTNQDSYDELKTYHPRMDVRALSPYRIPEPGQAAVILNKPVPLPDPGIYITSFAKKLYEKMFLKTF